jgi:beta-glucosidase-like glycosyl hydrolase
MRLRHALSLSLFLYLHRCAGQAPNDAMDVWECDGSSARMAFAVLDGMLVLNKGGNLALGVVSNASGTPLTLQPAAPSWSTRFTLRGDGTLFHEASGRCAVVSPGAVMPVVPPGAPVKLFGCGKSADATWVLDGALVRSGLASSPPLCLDAQTRVSCASLDWASHLYCNNSLPRKQRLDDLVDRLTQSDAIWLMSRLRGVPRLGLPDLNYYEALHGVRSSLCLPNPAPGSTGCATSFPVPIAQAASFNKTLWRAVANAIGNEARAVYNVLPGPSTAGLMYYAPNSNIFMNPLWGRGMETAGEDPTVLAEFAAAFITGMQTSDEEPRYAKVGATLKHFIAYTLEEVGGTPLAPVTTRYNFDAKVSIPDLVRIHLPPFAASVSRGRALSAMCSYQSLSGVPMCANHWANQQLLRDTLHFDGVMGSDCGAVGYLLDSPPTGHNTTNSTTEMISLAVNDGTCEIACDDAFQNFLAPAFNAGVISDARLREILERICTLFFDLGLLDPPSVFDSWGAERVDTATHRALALEAATQAVTLLKNSPLSAGPNGAGQPLLPLPATTKVAFIGPNCNATQTLVGNYAGLNTLVNSHSLLQAALARAPTTVSYSPGCLDTVCNSTSLFASAVAAAKVADAVVLCLGLTPVNKYGDFALHQEGEALDRTVLTLPGNQSALAEAVLATGVPTAGVLINGGTVALDTLFDKLDSIVAGYYGGELGGDALAAVLFGDRSPAGRLPYTAYDRRFIDTRPPTDMSMDGGMGITYMYFLGTYERPFGYGLSYTSFSFQWMNGLSADLVVDARQWSSGVANVSYAVNITNVGTVTSDVSALAFFSTGQPGAPLSQLFDFGKVSLLAPGASATVLFSLPAELAAEIGADGSRVLRAGDIQVAVGDVVLRGESEDGRVLRATLRVTGEDVLVKAALPSNPN